MEKEKLFTKDFITTSVVNFVLTLSMYLLLVVMATYAIETHAASASMAGFVASIFIIGSLCGRLFAGRLITKLGTKKMLIIGTILFLIMTLCYFIPSNLLLLMAIRLIHGIGFGIATTATGTIVSQVMPASRGGEGIGYFSLSTVLSTAIGPLIGIYLMRTQGFESIFVFSFIIGVVSLLLTLFIKPPYIISHVQQTGFKWSQYFEVRSLPISLMMFYGALAYSSILSFITAHAAEVNLMSAGSLYFLVYALIILASRPFTGRIMDIRGGNSIIYPGIILFAIGLVLLSQSTSTLMFLLAAAIIGLGYGNFQSATQAIAVKAAPKERMGLANSTYFIFLDLGLGFGPVALGYLIPTFGYRGVYLGLAAYMVVGIFVYFLLHGRKDKQLLAETT